MNSTTPRLLRLQLLLLLSTRLFAQATEAPGYEGPVPSAEATKVLAGLANTEWTDSGSLLGGGVWTILPTTGPAPHALGPARGDAIEARTATVKGPHVRLVQGKRAFVFPVRTDGDVAELWRMLKGKAHPELRGTTSPEMAKATAIVNALGPVQNGLRIALVPGTDGHAVEVVICNATDEVLDVRGTASIVVGEETLAVEALWPKQSDVAPGESRLRLKPGSTFTVSVDLRPLLESKRGAQASPEREAHFAWKPSVDAAAQKPEPTLSKPYRLPATTSRRSEATPPPRK